MQSVVLLLAFVALVSAAPQPKREECEAPKEWEAYTQAFDFLTGYYSRGQYAYDANKKRVHFAREVFINDIKYTENNLYLYKENVHYRVDVQTKNCSKLTLDRTFIPIEVRPNSTFIGDAIIGTILAPGTGVTVQLWNYRYSSGALYQTFTKTGCIPFETIYIGEHGGSYINYHFQFFDVVPGISDPSIFDIPQECL